MNKFVIGLLVGTVTSTCVDDFSTRDNSGDDCNWYTSVPQGCGNYDDSDFSANSQCCACGGGLSTNGGGSGGSNGGCVSDESTADNGGDSCSWYDSNPNGCGSYDDADFTASTQCCACGGGNSSGGSSQCVSDESTADNGGDSCSWYDVNPQACGSYDDSDFSANSQCCACGGGAYQSSSSGGGSSCVNDDSQGDSAGDTCTLWYDSRPETCGSYDTLNFNSHQMCCACGGGSSSGGGGSSSGGGGSGGSTDGGCSSGGGSSPTQFSIDDFVLGVRGMLAQAGCNQGCIDSVLAAPADQVKNVAQICNCSMSVTVDL